MVTIGENLDLQRYELKGFDGRELQLHSPGYQHRKIAINDVEKVELVGIKNNSGYSGTMEWGMKNPTFLLPTNFWFAILNWFKRSGDDLYFFKVSLKSGEQVIACSGKKFYKEILSCVD